MPVLYLHKSLVKSKSDKRAQEGQQRGGSYVARISVGYDANNKPKYRYFRSSEEYKAYLEQHGGKKGKKDKASDKLQQKVKKEHEKGSERAKREPTQRNLYVKDKKKGKKDKKDKAKKSLSLFIGVDDNE